MRTLKLTRQDMAELLLSLKRENNKSPMHILQNSFSENSREPLEGKAIGEILSELPLIFGKLFKSNKKEFGFSINEIVTLGNQIEFNNLTQTAVQNWVKRDVKGLIGSPQMGKKYSIEQAAMLFIVEDLKTALDFDSIRKVLRLAFNDLDDRSDDLINPVHLYFSYASIFERLKRNKQGSEFENKTIEQIIEMEAESFISRHQVHLSIDQKKTVTYLVMIATLAVKTAYYQSMSRSFLNAALFLHDMNENL